MGGCGAHGPGPLAMPVPMQPVALIPRAIRAHPHPLPRLEAVVVRPLVRVAAAQVQKGGSAFVGSQISNLCVEEARRKRSQSQSWTACERQATFETRQNRSPKKQPPRGCEMAAARTSRSPGCRRHPSARPATPPRTDRRRPAPASPCLSAAQNSRQSDAARRFLCGFCACGSVRDLRRFRAGSQDKDGGKQEGQRGGAVRLPVGRPSRNVPQ